MLSDYTIEYIKLIATRSPNREICGLIDSEEAVYPIVNVSTIPSDFIFSKAMYGRVLREIKTLNREVKCVYHSHLNNDPTPTANDINSMHACKLDYLIVANNTHTYTRFEDE